MLNNDNQRRDLQQFDFLDMITIIGLIMGIDSKNDSNQARTTRKNMQTELGQVNKKLDYIIDLLEDK
nr:MAG: hypothetical protein [Bacteriophage sp.]